MTAEEVMMEVSRRRGKTSDEAVRSCAFARSYVPGMADRQIPPGIEEELINDLMQFFNHLDRDPEKRAAIAAFLAGKVTEIQKAN